METSKYDMDLTMFCLMWVAITCIISLILNGLLMATILGKKRIWTSDIKLIFILSISDCLTSVVVMTLSLSLYIIQFNFANADPTWCQIIGLTVSFVDTGSVLAVSLLSLERFSVICLNKASSWSYNVKLGMGYLLIGLVLGVIAGSFRTFVPTSSGQYCAVSPNLHPAGLPYFIFLFASWTMGILIITFCYLNIMYKSTHYLNRVRKESQTVRQRRKSINIILYEDNNALNLTEDTITTTLTHSTSTTVIEPPLNASEPDLMLKPSLQSQIDQKKFRTKVIMRSLIFIIVYIFCYMPNLISWWIMGITQQAWPFILDILIICTFHITHLGNAFLALTLHTTIRKDFKEMLKLSKLNTRRRAQQIETNLVLE